MLIQNEALKPKQKEKRTQILDTAELTESILEDAFKYANGKMMILSGSANNGELLARRDYLEAFRVGLGNAVTQALIENDGSIVSVFRFEPTANSDSETEEDLPVDGNVYLIALVDRPSAGLEAFAVSLNRALTERMNSFSPAIYKKYSAVLDVKFVTSEEVEKRKGYAVLLTSIFSPPTRIWQRE